MNKRLAKKIMKQSYIKINKIKPKEDEIIVFNYEQKSNDMRVVKQIFDMIKQNLPNNKIFAVPKGIELKTEIKDKIIEQIQKI